MTNLFKKAFINVLHEAPEDLGLPPAGGSDADAMASTLDKGTNPEDFNVDANAASDHMQATSKMQANMVSSLQSWITKMEEMAEYLNGTGNESVQSKLKNCVPDTLFDKIRVAETKKIARVAMEITSLNEMLKGYLASASDPKYKGV
jgi:hypothetical protein